MRQREGKRINRKTRNGRADRARLAQFKDYSLLDKCRRSKDHKLLSREQFKEKEQKRSRKAARPKKDGKEILN